MFFWPLLKMACVLWGEQLNYVALKMEFGQEHRLNLDRMMYQHAGEPEY